MAATATRWTRVERVLDRVLDHPTDMWPALVEAECAGDAALHRDVESLLQRAANLDGYLQGPAARVTALLHGLHEEAERVAERVGPWRLGEEIGRGGMGIVYHGTRADGLYQQSVAVKLLRAGGGAGGAARRFAFEREILARLDHPGIARLLDGGVTEPSTSEPEGRPFLVMEYVAGEALDAYCDRRALSVETRLRLFLDACDAVAYAHRHLVVHRDLKPGNIFVTEASGQPRVKLLDFGIAKLLSPATGATVGGDGAPANTALTQMLQRPFTPEYAAPEQVEGRAATTATDVYGLGVVLFELLAGRRPFLSDPAAPRAIERAVLEAAPPRLSVVAPAARRRRLAGDLDAIVAKALRKEPEARYPTANALAVDLRRHLDGLPVEARKGAAGYRARKFVARHRAGVLTALGVFLLLGVVVGIAFARVTAERDRAQAEAAKALAVSDFLAGLFEQADPDHASGDTLNVFELLDRGATRVRSGLAEQPEVQTELLRTVADVYLSLGQFAPARDAHLDALRLLRQRPRRDYEAEAYALARLTALHRMHGRLDDALGFGREALSIARAHLDPSSFAYTDALNRLADLQRTRGAYAEAAALFEEALPLRRRHFAGTPALADVLNNYALLLEHVGRYEASLRAHREALALHRATLGDRHPNVALNYQNLASLMFSRGHYARALSYALQADDIHRVVYAPGNPYRLGNQTTIGRTLVKLGRFDDAEPVLQAVLSEVREEPDSGHRAGALLALAESRGHEGRWDESDAMMEEALRIHTRTSGSESAQVGRVRLEQGRLALQRGDRAAAAVLLQEALRVYRLALPEDHPRLAETGAALAEARGE